jgi:D-inositol-3-phosphate glycosyltransferase
LRIVLRIALISMHTSPLARAGSGDAGGMNVYVREIASTLSQEGADCTTYTRRWDPGLPDEVELEPRHRVVHLDAGPPGMAKEDLVRVVDEFTEATARAIEVAGGVDVLHAHYWLSGLVGHRLKHRLGIPLVTTFHTLARVKGRGGDPESSERERAELEVIGCSDAICVSCDEERRDFRALYGASPGTLVVAAPGVHRAFFSPGDRRGARDAIAAAHPGLALGDAPVLTVVGRLQPLKGVDVAVRALAALRDTRARLLVVGGASGPEGELESRRLRALASTLGVAETVTWVAPQPHHLLSTYYRAADVVLVPSRSESFGLVALEAAACGIPVVASDVGGLRSVVRDGVTGLLVPSRDHEAFARAVRGLLADPPRAIAMGTCAAERASAYSWRATARAVREAYDRVGADALVACS